MTTAVENWHVIYRIMSTAPEQDNKTAGYIELFIPHFLTITQYYWNFNLEECEKITFVLIYR